MNEARLQYTSSRFDQPVNDTVGPAVGIAGVAVGTATFSPLGRDINLFEAVNNVSTQRGDHSVKAGGGFLYNCLDILFRVRSRGLQLQFINNFLTGNYISYQQAFGVPDRRSRTQTSVCCAGRMARSSGFHNQRGAEI